MNHYKASKNQSKKIDLIIFSLVSLLLSSNSLIYYDNSNIVAVNAQYLLASPPLPTLDKEIKDKENAIQKGQFPTAFQPPTVEVITKALKEGKNVIRINASSEAAINYCKITFSKEATKRTVDCVQDKGSIYKALIDAKHPYQTVEIQVRDIYGDSTTSIEKLNVASQLPIPNQIWNLLAQLFSAVNSIL
jgi:hypothetical protein